MPTTPQNAAGRITEPRVCVPSAALTSPAATAAAEPLDEPPGVCAGFQGLQVGPGWRHANSVVTVLPVTKPPSERNRATTQASAAGTWPAWIRDPFAVTMSAVAIKSFTPNGIPARGPAAAASGKAGLMQVNAFSTACDACALATLSRANSPGDISPARCCRKPSRMPEGAVAAREARDGEAGKSDFCIIGFIKESG